MRNPLTGLALSLVLGGSMLHAAERGTVTGTVGGSQLTIEYGRPELKGRPFADLLKQLPEDRVWRAGENQVTTLTTTGPLAIGGKTLPAGKYSLYVHLGADGSRSLLVNSDPGTPLVKIWAGAPPNLAKEPWPRLDGYTKNVATTEVARVPLEKQTTASAQDTFTIALTPAKEGASLKLAWGTESWSTDVKPAH